MNKQFQDLLKKYSQTVFYYPDKNMIYWEEIKTTNEINNDIGELIGDKLYVKMCDEMFQLSLSAELYELHQHEGCSCDIMFVKPEDQLTTKDCHVDLMYEGGLWTFESLNGKDCICIYLNE